MAKTSRLMFVRGVVPGRRASPSALLRWCTRSIKDGIDIIERMQKRGAFIKVLDMPHLDLTTPLGRGFIAFLSALAENLVKTDDGARTIPDTSCCGT
ncbi:MAG TPA: hypothetical protein VKD28_08020, partial [Gemmatimonadales bacterium]|nr:hypothetical protein [Gemmatimonadales bacterium]